ncbi:serine hydrolase domain-containing protein [Streptomyces sp. HNM0574]|uniref:serine hydrolase domain-containing protein n=1 Tax=Streptomyces sp. HNM0574 TaxID=2714954 RepID=UPI00146D54CC|nr:serine hydrolase domain-containing protein [Streptomyces sp. HNM0574]NLU70011.1 beta-lactamase family protein [Streptomyces sp. HNM0574]
MDGAQQTENGGSEGNVVDVQGTVADGYEPVRDAFIRNFEERGDTGASLTVHRDGEPVVDLWGGTTGAGSAWDAGTAAIVRSATKGPAAAVLHILHQRGRLDLDAPVGTYWPEFKANGKDRVLVRHLLSHRAGLPVLDVPLTPAEAVDGVSGPAALAAQGLAWEPGTTHGYHAQTYGWLLAEVVRRATGRTIGRWFDEEVARPYGLDLWMGLPPEVEGAGRVAPVHDVPTPETPAGPGLRVRPKPSVTAAWSDPDSLTRRAFAVITPHPDENDPAYRAAELPSSAGVATARGLSRFYASLIGPLPGAPRLFTPATLTQARSEESAGPDRVLVVGTRFGLGFMLHGPSAPMLGPGSFGHPGRGGSLGFADPESRIAFGYVTGGLQQSVTSDPRAEALVRALATCL